MTGIRRFILLASLLLWPLGSLAAEECRALIGQWIDPASGDVVDSRELLEQVAGEALRILGKAGCRPGSAAAGAYRSVKLTQSGGTSTEIARVKIGDAALGY